MKSTLILLLTTLSLFSFAQGFVAELEDDGYAALGNSQCIVKLANGEEITGKIGTMSGSNGYISAITIKLENGEKRKLKPEDISQLQVKTSKLMKLAMITESSSSIKEMTRTNFDDIVKRDFVIFETAMRHNKAGNLRLMQLLNPGFDSKIKVYADPNPNRKTDGIGIAGVKLTGDVEKSYLFVQNNEKAVLVKKGSYKKDFDELYKNCPKMIEAFAGEKLKFQDIAGHVFAYDQICQD
ncbi:MAG: hypothetical protein MUE95_12930 [Cyclobacteriaceae bacterium]|nr:hypothetical protein [Cyclobacteriaceae bacterium]